MGCQHNLGPDKRDAVDKYHALLAERKPGCDPPAAQIIDKFLAWSAANSKPATHEWYSVRTAAFRDFVGNRIKTSQLKPQNITDFLLHAKTAKTAARRAIRCIKRPFNWAFDKIKQMPTLGC